MNQPPERQHPTAYQPVVVLANPGQSAATWSLVTGILAYFCLPVVGAVIAVVLGYVSRSETKSRRLPTHGTAVAGITLGMVQLALIGIWLLLWLITFLLALIGSFRPTT